MLEFSFLKKHRNETNRHENQAYSSTLNDTIRCDRGADVRTETPIACGKVISALTNPITMTVVGKNSQNDRDQRPDQNTKNRIACQKLQKTAHFLAGRFLQPFTNCNMPKIRASPPTSAKTDLRSIFPPTSASGMSTFYTGEWFVKPAIRFDSVNLLSVMR